MEEKSAPSADKQEEKNIIESGKHHFVKKTIESSEDPESSADFIEQENLQEQSQEDLKEKEEIMEKPEKQKTRKKTRKVKRKKRSLEKQVESDLADIYKDSDGNMPDMKKIKKVKHSSLIKAFFVLIFSCIFLASVAWLGFFVMQPDTEFSQEDVIVSISGPDQIGIGQEVKYRIRYRNAQNVLLNNVTIEVRYPQSFEFATSTVQPSGESMDRWELGNLQADDSGYIDVEGFIEADIDSDHSFRLFFNYTPQNFSSPFQKVHSTETKISESPVIMSVQGPEESISGSVVEYKVVVELEDEDFTGQKFLVMEPGLNFSVKESNLEPIDHGAYEWLLASTTTETVVIQGVLLGGETGGQESIKFMVQARDQEGEYYTLAQEEKTIKIVENGVSANLIINGAIDSLTAFPGDILNASIVVENTGSKTLEDLNTKLVFEAPSYKKKSIFAWSRIDDLFDGDIRGEQLTDSIRLGEITWAKKHIEDFKKFEPGDKVVIDLILPVKTSDDIDLSAFEDFAAQAYLDLKFEQDGGVDTLSSSHLNIVFNSDMDLEVRDEIGTSNGKEKHTITWLLTNSFHELNNVVLEADLYGDFNFDPEDVSVPAGEIEYNETDQKLLWKIETMPTNLDVLALQFDLILNKKNPSQTNLTSRVRGTAIDSKTGEEVLAVGDEVLF